MKYPAGVTENCLVGGKPHICGVRSVVSVVVGECKGDRKEEEKLVFFCF